MTTLELQNYYANLLIFQYLGKPKAYGTIQTQVRGVIMPQTSTQDVSFSQSPSAGSFILSYNGVSSAVLNWNDTASTIQTALQSVTGLSAVTVSGSIASNDIEVTFTGVIPPALSLEVLSNSLLAGGQAVSVNIVETDLTLPLAVQNSYNLIGDEPATGIQLDVLGKYAGVTRVGTGLRGQVITLDDSDFLRFIQMAIATNSSGSSLYDIDQLMTFFFPNQVLVFDYADMRMAYLISSTLGSMDLIELFITENLLPRPMGVQIAVIYAPIITAFFGFVTYRAPTQPAISRPFNDYSSYQTDWPWLTYKDGIIP